MKPRAAIVLSGRISGWQHCLADFESAFSFYDYDIYCSLNCKEDDIDLLDFSKYKKVKKINAALSLDYLDLSKFEMNSDHERINMLSMFLHNKFAFNLIEEEYDLYIKARIDFITKNNEGINFNSHIPLFSKDELNKLWIPSCHKYGTYKFKMNDQFAISNYENLKKYCSLIDSLHIIKKEFPDHFSPESVLAIHLDKLNIPIEEFDFDYLLSPKRNMNNANARNNEMWRFVTNLANELGIKVE